MPALGSVGLYHGRYPLISKKLWKKYCKDYNSTIPYKQFKEVISASFQEISKCVLKEPVGFRMPYRLGNFAVNKFRTYGEFKTYSNVKSPEGNAIRNHNLHTGGHTFRIQWFHNTRSAKERVSFWYFVAERKFKRSLATVLKSGKSPLYNTYMQDQFIINK